MNDEIEYVQHIINDRILIEEQIDERGTLGFDIFVDGIYKGSRQEFNEAVTRANEVLKIEK